MNVGNTTVLFVHTKNIFLIDKNRPINEIITGKLSIHTKYSI